MELAVLLLSGSLSGLLSVLLHSVVRSAVEIFRPTPVPAISTAAQVSDALLHMLCGVGLGFTFWLSWGLAAIIDVPWWVRGLSFGSLCWVSLALPATVSVALARGIAPSAVGAVALRWATTCVIAGLACSWSWQAAS